MFDITQYLTDEHRECDELYAEVEKLVGTKRWDEAEKAFERFKEETIRHFRKEEEVLFPECEGRTGILMGPTQVMRSEHAQARELMDRMEKALRERNREAFLSAGETLMILIQQHNMKEEQILYPMCDQHLDPVEMVEKNGKTMTLRGLSPLQAPPFIVVAGFFITACLLWFLGSLLGFFAILKDSWSLPLFVHINTIGLALFTMTGALFQMLPVVAGAVIKNPKRKALISGSLLLSGCLPFLLGFYFKSLHLVLVGGFLLLIGAFYTSLLMLHPLINIRSYTPTSKGMKFALLYLMLGAIAGFVLILSYWVSLPYRAVLLEVHLVSMLFGWVLLLVASVSFQVVEMFFVTEPYPKSYAMNFPYLLTVALFLSLWDSPYTKMPLALLVLFQALFTLKRLAGRKRKTADKLPYFWYLAFLNLMVSVPFYLLKDVSEVFFHYFLMSFGLFFTTLIVGMMLRIVSFLVWFHLSNEGIKSVPLMSEVINQKMVGICLYLMALLSVSLYSLYFTKLYLLPSLLHLLIGLIFSFCIIKGCMLYFKKSPLYNPSG